jgi:hypothetical protein
MRPYSDEQLAEAVAASRSWRGVLRTLGLNEASASALRSARRRANELELDYTHFTGQRRWTDRQLATAVASSMSWNEVSQTLGLAGGSSTTTLRGHSLRLGLDTTHLARPQARVPVDVQPRARNLARAGSMLAAAWFELCGYSVSWPLEPCRYDLLVWRGGRAERIQVKTTTVRAGRSWVVRLATQREELHTYDPDEIDQFFVIDGDLNHYLIPIRVVGGLTAIQLSAYEAYLLPRTPSLDAG